MEVCLMESLPGVTAEVAQGHTAEEPWYPYWDDWYQII